ncbi:MAG: glycosyltransferase [Methanosarcinaceae archaeon]
MNLIKKIIKKLFFKSTSIPITIYPKNKHVVGRVLFSYLAQPILLKDDSEVFYGHSNKWESTEIVKIFNNLGFTVDAIDWNNSSFIPTKKYDVFFDINTNLKRLNTFINKQTINIFHITGSNPYFSNSSEQRRISKLYQRKKKSYQAKRFMKQIEAFESSLNLANYCSLIGNNTTLQTFPKKISSKTSLISPSSSINIPIKSNDEYIPKTKEFLWFAGSGAVHKGLDLLLDIFVKHTNLTLNIVGSVDSEEDFVAIYKRELFNTPNIKYHGFCLPNSKKFKQIIDKSFCFIAPSCSEGISTACTTCLQIGLYPIVSRNTGIDLPTNCGIYLKSCSLKEIEKKILKTYKQSSREISEQIAICQSHALEKYSRKNFSKQMTLFIQKALVTKESLFNEM